MREWGLSLVRLVLVWGLGDIHWHLVAWGLWHFKNRFGIVFLQSYLLVSDLSSFELRLVWRFLVRASIVFKMEFLLTFFGRLVNNCELVVAITQFARSFIRLKLVTVLWWHLLRQRLEDVRWLFERHGGLLSARSLPTEVILILLLNGESRLVAWR
jgi:hypothetical protein